MQGHRGLLEATCATALRLGSWSELPIHIAIWMRVRSVMNFTGAYQGSVVAADAGHGAGLFAGQSARERPD